MTAERGHDITEASTKGGVMAKHWVATAAGPPESWEFEEYEPAAPREGEVTIRVRAAGAKGEPLMLKRFLCRPLAVGAVVLASSLVLSACAFLPGVPEDQPLSLAVRGGTPILSWCAPSAEIVRVRVYYGTVSADDAELVIDARGRLPVAPGAEVTPDGLPEEWVVERHEYAGAELSEIGVTVDYEARDAEGELVEGSFGADFENEGASDLDSWPDNGWIWANGTVSTDPCGMPSSHE